MNQPNDTPRRDKGAPAFGRGEAARWVVGQ